MDASNSVVILLADDDEDDRMLTVDALRVSKVANNLKTVNDGEELMNYLRHCGMHAPPASSPRPALILLDLNMPRKNGWEVLKEIKADPALRSIPVIVLTTSKEEEDVERTYDLGVNSFIMKPVSFAGLVEVMNSAIEYWFKIVQLPSGPKEP